MRKLSIMLALSAFVALLSADAVMASQMPTCPSGQKWDWNARACVGTLLHTCRQGDPNCPIIRTKDRRPDRGPFRRCPPGKVEYLGSCIEKCAAGIANLCNIRR